MAANLEDIRIKFQERKRRKKITSAFSQAIDFLQPAYEVTDRCFASLKTVDDKLKKSIYRKIIINNFLINCITSIEIYCKEIIIERNDWNELGLNALLKEKITLGEAFELFNKEKVTREYIVSHFNSFQNFAAISECFSKLTNCDFFKEMEKHLVNWEDDEKPESLIDAFPEWRHLLAQAYQIRNKYVHEGVVASASSEDIIGMYVMVTTLMLNLDDWFEQRSFS